MVLLCIYRGVEITLCWSQHSCAKIQAGTALDDDVGMVELMIVSRLNAITKLSKYSSAFKSVKCSENYKINH